MDSSRDSSNAAANGTAENEGKTTFGAESEIITISSSASSRDGVVDEDSHSDDIHHEGKSIGSNSESSSSSSSRSRFPFTKWTKENDLLLQHLKEDEKKTWKEIAVYFNGSQECKWRYLLHIKEGEANKMANLGGSARWWWDEDVARLLTLIEEDNGIQSWEGIAKHFEGQSRTTAQCQKKYYRIIKEEEERIAYADWTKEDLLNLKKLRGDDEESWKTIASSFEEVIAAACTRRYFEFIKEGEAHSLEMGWK
jgi:hypothetical protein